MHSTYVYRCHKSYNNVVSIIIFSIFVLARDVDWQKNNEIEYGYEEEKGGGIPVEYYIQCSISASNCPKFFIIDLFKYLDPLHDTVRHLFFGQKSACIIFLLLFLLCDNLAH